MRKYEKKELSKVLRDSINNLIETYLDTPQFFWKEYDIQSYLYYLLLKSRKFVIEDPELKKVLLVHREYVTPDKYKKNGDFLEKVMDRGGRRGNFDLVVWDPDNKWESHSSKYKIWAGIEIKFESNVDNGRSPSTRKKIIPNVYNDYRKLTDKNKNTKIEERYILYFVRVKKRLKFTNIDEIQKHINNGLSEGDPGKTVDLNNVYFAYVEYNHNDTPIKIKNFE